MSILNFRLIAVVVAPGLSIVCLAVVGLALAGIVRLRDRRRRRKLREAIAEWESCERELMRRQEFKQSMRDVEMYREFEAPSSDVPDASIDELLARIGNA